MKSLRNLFSAVVLVSFVVVGHGALAQSGVPYPTGGTAGVQPQQSIANQALKGIVQNPDGPSGVPPTNSIDVDKTTFCVTDADCAQTVDFCGMPMAVNRQYLKSTIDYMRAQKFDPSKCPQYSNEDKAVMASLITKCSQSLCAMMPK